MKELILWKEVDVKDELPPADKYLWVISSINGYMDHYIDGEPNREKDVTDFGITHWLKRVVVNILSDQEIGIKGTKYMNGDRLRRNAWDFEEGYKAKQNELTGGEGL